MKTQSNCIAEVAGTGMYVPVKIRTNSDLEKTLNTSDEWIRTRTGIRERRIAGEDESSSTLAIQAGKKALEAANISPEEVNLVIVCTSTPDILFPATACFVQNGIGAVNAAAYDISAVCSGFVFGISIAEQYIKSGRYRHVLVIGSETNSRIVDWSDRSTCILFGDGAGAMLLKRSESNETRGLLSSHIHSDGGKLDFINVPGGIGKTGVSHEAIDKGEYFIKMSGNATFKVAVRRMAEVSLEALDFNKLSIDNVDLVVPHQANQRIIEAVTEKLGIPLGKVFINIEKYGNTSAAFDKTAYLKNMTEQTTLVQHLQRQQKKFLGATGEFTSLINEILVAAKIISLEVNKAGIGGHILGTTGNLNVHGEEVQKLDEFANSTFVNIMSKSGAVCAITSEEMADPVIISKEDAGKYIFMMDPLDGSSNIDINVSIGTIFSIYRKKSTGGSITDDDLLQKGADQVAGGYIIYGSSTMFVYSSGNGVHGFTLDPSLGEFFLSHPNIKIPDQGNIYSVNEGNSYFWEDKQSNLINYFKKIDKDTKRPYRGRYIGTMVSDFHRTLLKGGIFMYPSDSKNPNGKLRFAFEASPLAFIVENAGGCASTGRGRILDITPSNIHQCVPLYIGSRLDVETVERFFRD